MLLLHRPNIFVLLEPRISGDKIDKFCKSMKFEEWVRVESFGYSGGGLWFFWNPSSCLIAVIYSNPQFIHYEVEDIICGPWLFTCIYRSLNVIARNMLWDALGSLC